jgi:hypothetical protein
VLVLWRRAGVLDVIGEDAVYPTVEDAVRSAAEPRPPDDGRVAHPVDAELATAAPREA